MSPRPNAIISIMRKDTQVLWPLALAVVALQLVVSSTLHTSIDYPGVQPPSGSPGQHAGVILFWLGVALPPVLSTVFIFLAVQTDVATDIRHDWLTRPVGAFEIVVAKTTLVLGVVFVPAAIGNTFYALANGFSVADSLLPMTLILRNCLGAIMLAWLVSSALQAVLALVGLVFLTAIVTAAVMAVLTGIYYVALTQAGTPPDGPPELRGSLPMLGRIAVQLAWAALIFWPVLWLLLSRRKSTTARLLFFAAFVVNSALQSVELKPAAPEETAHAIAQTSIREAAHE